jgi:nitroreductase
MTNEAESPEMPAIPPLSMPLEEAMRTQRAIRRLKADPVDDALVLRLIELALKAPTGRNAQNWEFVIVKDRRVKARLARLYRIAWGVYGRLGRRLMARDPQMQRLLDAVQWQVDHFEDIPVLVVACLRGLRPLWPPLAVTSYYGSIYPSVQNLLLAALAAGLGAVLITLPLWSTWLARRALGLPWRVTPCAVVALGWPIGSYGPTRRRPVGDVVHLDRYGHQPFKRSSRGAPP